MPENDEFFTAADVDEQIDFLERESGDISGAARPEERLVSHLRHFYGEQAHAKHDPLEHAWQRLVARYQTEQRGAPEKGRIIFMQDYQNEQIHVSVSPPRQKRSWVQRLSLVAAILIVGLLVGSMVLVLNAARQQRGHTQKQQSITGSGGTPMPKPPHPITGGKCTIDTTHPQSQKSAVNLPGLYVFAQNDQSDNVLYRYDPQTKKVVWSIKLCSAFETSGTVAQNGILYLAGADWTHEVGSGVVSYLYALNESDGSAIWGIQFPTQVVSSTPNSSASPQPTPQPTRVVTPGGKPFDPAPHSFSVDLGMIEMPTIVDNILYVVQRSGMVYAYDATTGSQLWTFNSGRNAWATTSDGGGSIVDPSSIQVVNGVAYFSIVDRLYALDERNGKKLWDHSFDNALNINQSPVIANGTIYVTAFVPGYGHVMHPDTYLYAFDAQTGTQKWVTQKLSGYLNGPLAYQGAVYALGYDGTWYTFDASNGALKAQKALTQYSNVQIINGVFYNITENKAGYGALVVLNPDGSTKWSIDLKGLYPGLAAVQNGIMYITTRDAGIYAYSATNGSLLWHYEGYLPQPQSNLMMTVVS